MSGHGSPGGERQTLRIVALGDVEPALTRWLAAELERRFGIAGSADEHWELREAWRVGACRCSADAVLDALQRTADANPGWRIAVTDADLASPARDWVFGVGITGGCCAVVSLARLGSDAALHGRLLKEVAHELGHLAGLGHCPHDDCVMHPSGDVASIDVKQPEFCAECLRRLVASGGSRRA